MSAGLPVELSAIFHVFLQYFQHIRTKFSVAIPTLSTQNDGINFVI